MTYRTIAQIGSFDIKSNWFSSLDEAKLKRDWYALKYPDAMIQVIDGTGWLIEITGKKEAA